LNSSKNNLFYFDSSYDQPVAGVDEVGRGPLAGPVVAAAVIIDINNIPDGINDSKKLSKTNRLKISDEIKKHSIYSIAEASVKEIDEINILQASLLAMKRAIEGLAKKPMTILVDGKFKPKTNFPTHSIIKGDSQSLSIAASSIIAKVYRDNLMRDFSKKYPEYLWEKNAGYGTKEHLLAIKKCGITPIHRKSFKPIHNILN
tara:strand:- start:1841 stop:2446 length:606 start_codon:yes stop_codon:yes gene_type:complete